MIAHLSGTLLSKQPTPSSSMSAASAMKSRFRFPPFTNWAKSARRSSCVSTRTCAKTRFSSYGFKTARERELFLQLISVNGVGPGLAIKLLSGMNADEMIASIRTNNLVRLVAIPGVGRKTAERLVVDLRDKIAALSSPALEEEFAAKAAVDGAPTTPKIHAQRRDVGAGKSRLSKAAAEKAVKNAIDEGGDLSVELILRRSLRSC